jgi:hypothetical protein
VRAAMVRAANRKPREPEEGANGVHDPGVGAASRLPRQSVCLGGIDEAQIHRPVEVRNDPNGRVLQSAPTPYQLLALRGWHKLRLGKSCTTSER